MAYQLFGWLGGRKRISELERQNAEWMERAYRLEESVAQLMFERDSLWHEVAKWRHAAIKRLDGINELEATVEQLSMQVESLTKKDLTSQAQTEYLQRELALAELKLKNLEEERLEAKPKASKAPAKKKK